MKQSLWDLKLFRYQPVGMVLFYFEAVPMGFETTASYFENYHLSYFEAVPMGFETHSRCIEIHLERHFEAVPMGFETS